MSSGPTFLRCRVTPDAVLIARPDLDDWSGSAGVVRRTRKGSVVVDGTGIRRFGREQIPRIVEPDAVVPTWQLDGAVFGGYLYDHYGHFLLESLARLWVPAGAAPAPVVWIAAWCESLSPWMHEVLDLLGVDERRHVVTSGTGPLAVDHLLIPDAGFEFGSWMHPWFGRRLASHPAGDAPHDHVWLSRSRRVPISGLDEEVELEQRLEAEGWTIVHPEDLSVREQVELLARATHVSGLEGSAFHTLALLSGCSARVDLFTRQDHLNFELVADACGLDQTRHTLPGATPRERQKVRGTDVQWSGVDIGAVVQMLRAGCAAHGHPSF
jgi:capsular polysaccharide biosynthesis protein